MDNSSTMLELCRLCLVKDDVNTPIFEEQGDIKQIFLKISSCLPVKVSREDQLPKKICDGCSYKLDLLYEFWNTSANAEKQLLCWLGEAGMNSKMTDGTMSAVAQQIKPTETLVKQEEVDPPDIHTEDDEEDDKSYMFQQKLEESASAGPSATVTSNEEEEPPPKRVRRTAAVKAAIAMDRDSDEDDDDSGEPMTKVEDESEDSEGDDHEPAFVDVPSTSADDQPGPSGVGKDGVDAPLPEQSHFGPDRVKQLMKKYNMRECFVKLKDVKLDTTFKFVQNSVKLPSFTRRKYTCYTCWKKFDFKHELLNHKRSHTEAEEEDAPLVVLQKKVAKPSTKKAASNKKVKEVNQNIKQETNTISEPPSSFPYRCESCKADFNSVEEVKKHPKNNCRFACNICNRVYNTMHGFSVHILQHKINATKPKEITQYDCQDCTESFEDIVQLRSHTILTHQTSNKENNGPIETEEFGEVNDLSCDLCFDIFTTQEELTEHKEFHKQLGNNPSNVVVSDDEQEDVSQTDEDGLNTSITVCKEEQEDIAEEQVDLSGIPVIQSSYSLASATENIPDNSVAQNVNELGYTTLDPNDVIPQIHFKCKKCHRTHMNMEEFEGHLVNRCETIKLCPLCDLHFDDNSKYLNHFQKSHATIRICKYCFETKTESKKMDEHILQHFKVFKNVCKICFRVFSSYQNFNLHLEKEHLNI